MALAEALHANSHLQELSLDSNKLSDPAAQALGRMLAANKALRLLRLGGNHIKDAGALAHWLPANTTLQLLDLESNDVADDGARALAAAVCRNRSLEALLLDNNRFTAAASSHLLSIQARIESNPVNSNEKEIKF